MNKKSNGGLVKRYSKKCGHSITLLAVAIISFIVGAFVAYFTNDIVYYGYTSWYGNTHNESGSECILVYSSDQLRSYLASYVNKRNCQFKEMTSQEWVDYYAMQIHVIHHSNTSSHSFEDAFHKLNELQDLASKSCHFPGDEKEAK
jgi:hypothetical protein